MTVRRHTLAELRPMILAHVQDLDEWTTPTTICDQLGVGEGKNWYRVALVCERLALAGQLEIKDPASRIRKFRRPQENHA
jgi:hypothetical protein